MKSSRIYWEKTNQILVRKEKDLVRLIKDLVQARSVNPPGDEKEVVDVLAREMEKLGLKFKILEHGENRRSIVSVLKGNGNSGDLVFAGHGDTVPVGSALWERDPFGGEESEGKVHGRGSSDMKSGVAAMLYAMAAISEAKVPLKGDMIYTVTAGEETDSVGARSLCETDLFKNADKMLIAEPSNLNIFVAEKGALWISVRTKGRTAHGSMPHLGVNAIEHLMDLLQMIRIDWKERGTRRKHPLLGKSTASIDIIRGGVATNVVADEAEASIDIRTLPGEDHQSIISMISLWIGEQISRTEGLEMTIEILNDRSPYEIDERNKLVTSLSDSILKYSGKVPDKMGAAFYTDASVFGPTFGFPIVICGPGEISMMHKPNEYVKIEELLLAPKIFADWAVKLLA